MVKWTHFKKRIYISLMDVIFSFFSLSYILAGFRITLSLVIFPVFLNLYKSLNPIITSVFTGMTGVIFRSLFITLDGKSFIPAFKQSYPEVTFHLVYGLIYYFLYYKRKETSHFFWFITVVLCDLFANLSEVIFRVFIYSDIGFETNIKSLILIALIRGGFAFIILLSIHYYNLFTVKKEHEERYRRLVILSSELESEVYYMNMNNNYIENVMSNAYNLYEKLENDDDKKMALMISKDVHEIKKNYSRVIGGIESIMEDKVRYKFMTLSAIMDILKKNIDMYIEKNNLNINLNVYIKEDVNIYKHYYIMSVFRNLIMNAIESIGESNGNINFKYTKENNRYIFIIEDNGPSIKENNINYIFEPGFSTKFNKDSGNIKRGIGLTVVKDIVEKEFRGNIEVSSNSKSTKFIIIIPIEEME